MSIRRAFVLALAFGLLGTASAQTLEELLTAQYHDKAFLLRHAFKKRLQEYSPDGTPVGSSEEGPWAVYGAIVVKRINVQGDRLTVEGKRALYVFDRSGSMQQFPDDRKHPAEDLTIVLHSLQPVSSIDDAAVLLGRVLALTGEDSVKSVPVYWQAQVAKSLGLQTEKETDPLLTLRLGTIDQKALRLNDLDKDQPPKIVYNPGPDFTDAARSRRFQGVVGLNVTIDPTGRVSKVRIVHPLGMGLDDNAVATVSKWRFAPARHNGQPVAVAVYIQIDFQQYGR